MSRIAHFGAKGMPVKTIEKTEFPDSSVIPWIGYSLEERDLEVQLVNGAAYLYYDVPWQIADGFREAESPGRYFNEEIVGRYRYDRLR
jgi:hypothetical protein